MENKLKKYTLAAQNGECVWISELREAFRADESFGGDESFAGNESFAGRGSGSERSESDAGDESGSEVILRSYSVEDGINEFSLCVPKWETEDEKALIRRWLSAELYNILSVRGGESLFIFADERDEELFALLEDIRRELLATEGGLGKPARVAQRLSQNGGSMEALVKVLPLSTYKAIEKCQRERPNGISEKLKKAACRVAKGGYVGIDVGGTDIKLCAFLDGKLLALKEFDWNPEKFAKAEELCQPIFLLARLMRACITDALHGESANCLTKALEKDCPIEQMEELTLAAERATPPSALEGLGLSFPDVVAKDRILGGETPKTRGIRNNEGLDYEDELRKIAALPEMLSGLCGEGVRVRCANDGNMAAFSAAMELCFSTEGSGSVEKGVLAHSLGTDLGTGWIKGNGEIPLMPLELYDILMDVGSLPAAQLPPEDMRSVCNENSGLSGLRRYMGQAAAFRLAWENDKTLLDGFTEEKSGALSICAQSPDLRKPCLEHLMNLAVEGKGEAEKIFISIGENLGRACREMERLCHTEITRRYIFGRFVKRAECFALIQKGCAHTAPKIELAAADEELAMSPLMSELAKKGGGAVAQFAQAVGAVYFSAM